MIFALPPGNMGQHERAKGEEDRDQAKGCSHPLPLQHMLNSGGFRPQQQSLPD